MQNPFADLIPGQPRQGPQPQQTGPVVIGAPRPRAPTPHPEQTPDESRRDRALADIAEYTAAHPPAPPGPSEGTITQQATIQARRANLEAASQQLLRLGELYRGGYQGGYSPTESLPDFVSPQNSQFNSAAAGLSEAAFASLRVPGVGSQSDAELRQFLRANEPTAQSFDVSNEERLDTVQRRLNEHRAQIGLPPIDWRSPPQPATPPPGTEQDQQAVPPPPLGSPPPPPPPSEMDATSRMIAPNQGPTQSQLTSETRQEVDPVLRGVAMRVGAMVARGAPDEQILEYMRRSGIDPTGTNIDQALQYRRTPDFQAWRRANPRAPFPFGESLYTRDVPQTAVRETISSLGNSPLGAYAVNAGDAVTFGTLDNMTDNPAQARAGMNALREDYPGASTVGSISGAALTSGAAELGLARAGMTGARAALAADTAYGAGYGAGSSDEGSRLVGAGTGALTSAAAGRVGRTAARGAGRLATGARDEITNALVARNVPLTVGAMAGRGGVLGRTARSIENKLESIPLLGDAIRARRQESFEGFNRAGFDEGLQPIGASTGGQIGETGIETANAAVSGAYTAALDGVRVPIDSFFAGGLRKVLSRGASLPGELGDSFRYVVREHLAPALQTGELTGQAYQALRQTMRQIRSDLKGQLHASDYVSTLRGVENELESLVRRRAPDVVPALNTADQAFRRTKVLGNAVAAARNTGGTFSPAQLGTASVTNARRYGGTEATTSRPFFELQRAGQEALPSNVPNSGTVDRAWIMAALPAAVGGAGSATGVISPEQGALLGALGLPYTRAGQRALQKLITSRPGVVRAAGERLIAAQGTAGRVGVGTVPLLPAPER